MVDIVVRHPAKVSLINIYIREAHPIDDVSGASFVHKDNTAKGICYRIAQTLDDAKTVASDYKATLAGTSAENFLLLLDDPATEAVKNAYEALPERIVVIDSATLSVVYFSGQGPFQYSPDALAEFLDKRCREV